ncbi:hypothetical protein OC834_006094 [Tilletia horrida]|nr:hypothetical protein OC834_006094 [Tilletia horrida]
MQEEWRGHDEYDATRIKLRDHATITKLELATKREKRNRADGGQGLKAVGSSSATLTREEVVKLSAWALKDGSTSSQIVQAALWSLQLAYQTRPSFEPDWTSQEHGKYGLREWWGWKVYRGRASAPGQAMTYKTSSLHHWTLI